MNARTRSRRDVMRWGVAAVVAALGRAPFALAADDDGEVIPFLEPQPYDPKRAMLLWDELKLTDWMTPTPSVYHVSHYGVAKVEEKDWALEVSGLVEKPTTLTLDQIKARPRKELTATLECGGNGMNIGFMGAIGNCTWAGTPLAPILKECGIKPNAIEVAFWGADHKAERIRNQDFDQNFARTLSVADALGRDDLLLCYEQNGKPLTQGHGFPLRLVVPGWYGIAWVKWLWNIELRDRRLMTKYIAREYVTIYGEQHGDKVLWKERSVGPLNVKSIVARVVKRKDGTLAVNGAAWTQGRVKSVELKIDDGPWTPVELLRRDGQPEHTWTMWTYDWKNASPGTHTLVSRATDEQGRVQPSADDPAIKLKKTYWEANQQVPRRVRIG